MSLHYVGEVLSGGVVFHTYSISLTEEQCFIMSLKDLPDMEIWSNVKSGLTNSNSSWDGEYNSSRIINQDGHQESAALACSEYDDGSWYLPSITESRMIGQAFWELNYHLSQIENAEEISLDDYWTSNEYSKLNAYSINFATGQINFLNQVKNTKKKVRPIKKVPC